MKRSPSERGQTLPLIAVAMIPVFALCALAVDVSSWRNDQRTEQTAADSAAIAGAQELGYANGNFASAARQDAASNGFTNGANNTTVTVNHPPTQGDYVGKSTAVEVIVKVQQPTFFSRFFGTTQQTITTRAVAMLTYSSGTCTYVLSTGSSAVTVNGTTFSTPTCGIIDNGGWTANGATTNATQIGVAGKITNNGNSFPNATPAPALPAPDPCQRFTACANLANHPPATTPCNSSILLNGTNETINPGVYCGTSIINGGTLTLNSGLYVFTDSLIMNGGIIKGTEVTLDFPDTGSIVMNGGEAELTAPTSDSYTGLTIYQPATNTSDITLNGTSVGPCPITSSLIFKGAVYAPGAQLTVNGSYWTPSTVVANSITLNGGSICVTNSGLPIGHVVLVE